MTPSRSATSDGRRSSPATWTSRSGTTPSTTSCSARPPSTGSCTAPTRSCWTARATGPLARNFPLAELIHKHISKRGRPSENLSLLVASLRCPSVASLGCPSTEPARMIVLFWDGASYHRSKDVRALAQKLGITVQPLPSYSPDFMPVEALWRWLREDVTRHHCHATYSHKIRLIIKILIQIQRFFHFRELL